MTWIWGKLFKWIDLQDLCILFRENVKNNVADSQLLVASGF